MRDGAGCTWAGCGLCFRASAECCEETADVGRTPVGCAGPFGSLAACAGCCGGVGERGGYAQGNAGRLRRPRLAVASTRCAVKTAARVLATVYARGFAAQGRARGRACCNAWRALFVSSAPGPPNARAACLALRVRCITSPAASHSNRRKRLSLSAQRCANHSWNTHPVRVLQPRQCARCKQVAGSSHGMRDASCTSALRL
jgi:hypothetical protein